MRSIGIRATIVLGLFLLSSSTASAEPLVLATAQFHHVEDRDDYVKYTLHRKVLATRPYTVEEMYVEVVDGAPQTKTHVR